LSQSPSLHIPSNKGQNAENLFLVLSILSIPDKYCKKIPPFLSFNNFVHLFPVPHEWKQLIENNSYFIYAPAVFAAAGSIFAEIFDSYTGTVKVQEAMGPDSRESNIMKKCAH